MTAKFTFMDFSQIYLQDFTAVLGKSKRETKKT